MAEHLPVSWRLVGAPVGPISPDASPDVSPDGFPVARRGAERPAIPLAMRQSALAILPTFLRYLEVGA